ncbi:MAG TPA: SRPBCC domain-containing protein, partial [Candidatus Binatia bacterium]|nr:SRPBCC domain-containing protein [Candidatus Binatia bacterium]
MITAATVSVHVTRRFAVAAERVFDAWLDDDLITRWMFGPDVRDEEIVRIALDARVGGRFSFVVRRGADEIDHVGTYLAIERP